jgi:hypothetical protein
VRKDLRALDDAKLAHLANRGLVKRARKMLESGTSNELRVEEDGTVVVSMDGAESRLPPDTSLSDCLCDCGARGVCRHVLFAVMVYNEGFRGDEPTESESWDPGELSDQALEAMIGSSGYTSARRLAGRGMQVEVRSGPPPTGLLPTCSVTFLVPHSLAHATCDCAVAGPCEHLALAVWAFREARLRETCRVELGEGRDRHQVIDEAHELMRELLADGAPGARKDLPDRLRRTAKRLAKEKMVWMKDLIEDVADSVVAYGDRAAYYDPARLGRLHTEWHARERASHGGGQLSPALVLGLGVAPTTALEHTRLTGLGARLKRRKERVYGEVFLADPDTSTVLTFRKSWSADDSLARVSVQRGLKFTELAAGQLVSSTAKRRANRTLILGRSRVAQNAVFAQTGEWGNLLRYPLLVTDYARLARELCDEIPVLLKPRIWAERVRVFQVEAVREIFYVSGSQTVWARVEDTYGNAITLKMEHSVASPGALASIASQLEKNPRFVSAEVRLESHGLTIEPLALVTDDGVVVPTLESDQGLQLEIGSVRVEDPMEAAFQRCGEALNGLVHRGLRHDHRTDIVKENEESLRRIGLVGLADSFRTLGEAQEHLGATGRSVENASAAWAEASLRLELARDVWLRERSVESFPF